MIEDKILIWRFRCGRREALGQIYCKYEALLLTVAAAILGDLASAEDVVHDVFVALAQSPDKVGLDGSLRHFLAVCVANRARDRLRARRDVVSVDEIEFHVPEGQQPEVMAAEQEQLRLAWEGLAQLPGEQREVVVLHLIAGLRFHQIAANLGISINTAQSRYRYGMEKLRSLLNGRDERMKLDRIELLIRTLRVRSTPDKRQEKLDDILAAHDQWRQSRTTSGRIFPGWVAKVAVAASVLIVVAYLAVMYRSPDRAVPVQPQTRAVSSPAEIITAGSLQRTFRQAGLEGVERQLDRAFELIGPWPTVLPEQGLL